MSSQLFQRSEPIPGYKLLERIGSGGFGEVWKCEAPGGIQKAIKFVYGDMESTGADGAPAEREHKALERVKQIRHPFILSLERYDIVDGRLVILTELADCNLWDRFRACRTQGLPGIPREELLGYLLEAAEALDLMNVEHQIQHLDIKPQNLFLVHRHVKVADFGMAKVFEGMRATITGGVTPVYAAPETFEGWISRHSDQYSLAIVYQELLTGVRPFQGANTKQLLLQHLTAQPNLEPLPEPDRPVIARALSKSPEDRFPSCQELIEALRGASVNARPAAGPSVPAAPPPVTPDPAQAVAIGAQTLRVMPPRPRRLRPATNTPTPQTAAAANSDSTPAPKLLSVPEQTGLGVLQPTLVIGLGGLGGRTVAALHAAIVDRFESLAQVPCVRLLAIDTDADALLALTDGKAAPFDAAATINLRLQRATHYSRPEIAPVIESWLDRSVLYRLPRVPATKGTRAFGRLAFVDHYRLLADRLKTELAAVITPAAVADADRATGLGLRTTRPRVILAASLSGGTGSAILADVAYLARAVMAQFGYPQGDVSAVVMVPPTDAPKQPLANACAALTEIIHWSRPDTTYEMRPGPRASKRADSQPPLNRILATPLGSRGASVRTAVGLAAGLMMTEILSPLARTLAGAQRPAAGGISVAVASTFRFRWPRSRLLRRAALRLTERLLQTWTHKDPGAARTTVTAWLDEQWVARRLQPELLIDRLHEACAAAIGQPADAKFDALIAPLLERSALGTKLDAYAACTVLDDLCDLVGKPLSKGELEPTPGLIQRIVGDTTQALAAEYDRKFAELAVHFIEKPGTRLVNAEETIHQMTDRLGQLIATYEELVRSLENEVIELYRQLLPQIGQLDSRNLVRRQKVQAAEVIDLLRAYPKKRYQSMVAGFALSTYRGMLGAAPEFLREANFCRERLVEAMAAAERAAAGDAAGASLGPGRDYFPLGEPTLDDAARALAASLTAEELAAFDDAVQAQIRKRFQSLVSWCMESVSDPEAIVDLIRSQAESVLAERLSNAGTADMFFAQFQGDEQSAHRAIAAAITESEPEVPSRVSVESRLAAVAVPSGPSGQRLLQLVTEAMPGQRVLAAESFDDVVIYRECPIALTDLPPMTTAGRQAYRDQLSGDSPPHARFDVRWSLPDP